MLKITFKMVKNEFCQSIQTLKPNQINKQKQKQNKKKKKKKKKKKERRFNNLHLLLIYIQKFSLSFT